ncbi:MAG TPA: hypothetical protein ENN84_01235, partial [Candidatus Marinimicrobia bacterium]|nr:hypothetical protein [Candidatus Neomarinimicrobiota bacterium]
MTVSEGSQNIGQDNQLKLYFRNNADESNLSGLLGPYDTNTPVAAGTFDLSADNTDFNGNGNYTDDNRLKFLISAFSSYYATPTLLIDLTASQVTSVSASTDDGSYTVGDNIDITINLDEKVVVSGTPQLALETGNSANYFSGSGSNTLTFRYTVQNGDGSADLEYANTSALTLNGGAITDEAGNAATLTLPAIGGGNSLSDNKAIILDTTAPTVSNVSSSNANDTYKIGDLITITIEFDEVVHVTGTPILELETGDVDRSASYSAGSGTNTLSFTYTVQSGDNSPDLDYKATNSLTLNGGTIRDVTGNDATLTLPALGAAGSLSANKNIVIDTENPTITNVSASNADNTKPTAVISYSDSLVKKDDAVTITASFDEDVQTPTIAVDYTGSSDDISATAMTATGDPKVFTHNLIIPAGNTGAAIVTVNAADLAGNDSTFINNAMVVDNNLPQFSNISPARLSFVNHQRVQYTLNKNIVSGSITWTRIDGSIDPLSPHILTLQDSSLIAGTHTDTLTATNLINGSIYNLEFTAMDSAGNSSALTIIDSITYDIQIPVVNVAFSDTMAKFNDLITFWLDSPEALQNIPQVAIQYNGDDTLIYEPMNYEEYLGELRWVRKLFIIPDTTDGYVNAVVNAADLAGNVAVTGSDLPRLKIDNTAPDDFEISYSRPLPNYQNFPNYYNGKTQSLSVQIPISAADTTLLKGRVQILAQAEGSAVWHSLGMADTIYTLLPKTLNLSDSLLNADFFDLPEMEEGRYFTLKARIFDQAGNFTTSPVSADTLILDRIAPLAGLVKDGLESQDIDYLIPGDSLRASWSGFSDGHTGLLEYHYGLEFIDIDPTVLDFFSVGLDTNVTDDLALEHNSEYRFHIFAVDSAGNHSDTLTTDGVLIDLVAPVSSAALEAYYFDTEWYEDSTLSGIASDDGSGLRRAPASLKRLSDGYFYKNGWLPDSVTSDALLPDGWTLQVLKSHLTNRENYELTVTAIDSAGNLQSAPYKHNFQYVVNQEPQFAAISDTQAVLEDSLYTLTLTAYDVDRGTISDDFLTFTMPIAPRRIVMETLGDTSIVLNWTPNNWETGDTVVSLIVEDAFGARDTLTFTLTVIPVNDPPLPFNLLSPLREFSKADSANQPFTWRKSVDVDDTTHTYRLTLHRSNGDTTFSTSDTTIHLDLLAIDFPILAPVKWSVTVSDTQFTVPSSDTLTFSMTPPTFVSSRDSVYDKLIQERYIDSSWAFINDGFQTLDWEIQNLPFFLEYSDSAGQTLHAQSDSFLFTINTHT